MFQSLHVRPSGDEDIPSLSQCIGHVIGERQFLTTVAAFDSSEVAAFREHTLRNGGVQWVVAGNLPADPQGVAGQSGTPERVLGWCDIAPLATETFHHVGRLGMGLVPEIRRQGWGRRLMSAAIGDGFAKGLAQIELEVFASNAAAIRLYDALGFCVSGRRREVVRIDGRHEDLLLMSILLPEWLALPGRHCQACSIG